MSVRLSLDHDYDSDKYSAERPEKKTAALIVAFDEDERQVKSCRVSKPLKLRSL